MAIKKGTYFGISLACTTNRFSLSHATLKRLVIHHLCMCYYLLYINIYSLQSKVNDMFEDFSDIVQTDGIKILNDENGLDNNKLNMSFQIFVNCSLSLMRLI